jgi:hypothetical protein
MGPGAAGRVAGSCGPWWPWRGQRGGCPGLRADRRVWSTDWMPSSHRTCSAAAEATDLTTKSAPKSSAHSCSRHRASPPRCFTYFSASRFKMEEVALQRLWRREVTASTTLQRLRLGLGAAACGGRQPSMSSSSAWGGGVWRQLGSGAALRSEALGREVSLSCRCPSTSRAGHPGRTASSALVPAPPWGAEQWKNRRVLEMGTQKRRSGIEGRFAEVTKMPIARW